MRYISTRQTGGHTVSFEYALLQGLARDGGLYLPERWPSLDSDALAALRGRPYAEVAAAVMAAFTGRAFSRTQLAAIAAESYADFDHPATAPLVQLDPDRWLLELFHGPTLAFKDFALQMVARLLDAVLDEARADGRRSSLPPRATPGLRRSRPSAAARRSRSWCSTLRAGSPRCSAAR